MASIIDTVANLAKRRGLVFQSGEIYGGTKSGGTSARWAELKENIKRQWWRSIRAATAYRGLDSAIIPREVWAASGHSMFHDPLVECLNCHHRHRLDHMQGRRTPPKKASTTQIRCLQSTVPGLRHPVSGPSRANQHDTQSTWPDRDRRRPALSAARNGAGHPVHFTNVVTTARKRGTEPRRARFPLRDRRATYLRTRN